MSPKKITVAFVGNPNCGKTTLFNAFTGANLKVANWPGVTVERKEGYTTYEGIPLTLVDLPGTYSLTSYSMEEKVARREILEGNVDVIVNVVDASSLERNLYLTLQLLEMGKPVILALNMMDIVEELGMTEQVFYYCNSEEKVQEVLDRNPNAHAYCWSNSVTMRRMMRDDSERRFMVQLDGYTGNEKAWENSRNFGFIVSTNLLWVNHSDLDEYGINQTYVDNILESGVVQVIHTDDPGGLVEYLAQKGRR